MLSPLDQYHCNEQLKDYIMNQKSNAEKKGNRRVLAAVVITLITGLSIGGAVGFGLCLSRYGKDLSEKSCSSNMNKSNKQKGGDSQYYSNHSSEYSEPNQCLKSNEMVSIPSVSAKQAIKQYGEWAGWVGRNIENSGSGNDEPVLSAGWTIPVRQLVNSLNGDEYVRAYLAIKESFDFCSKLPEIELILTPVELLPDYSADPDCNGVDRNRSHYFNLVRPCPQMCDTQSELYLEYENGRLAGREVAPCE